MIHLISVDCWWRCTHSSHSQTSINSQGEQCGRTSSRFVLHFGLILLFSGHRLTLKNINNKFIVSIDEKAGQCKWLPTAVCFSSITTNVLQHGSILDPEDRRLYPVNCKISKHLKDIWTSLEKKKKKKKEKKIIFVSRCFEIRTPANRSYQEETLGALPEGWEERVHSDGRIFYIDHSKQCALLLAFWTRSRTC